MNALHTCAALLALSATFSTATIIAAADDGKLPAMTLLSTDTADAYPFAAIEVNHTVYHVTVGDVLDGVSIRRIEPGRVILSGNQVLVAGHALRPQTAPGLAHDAPPADRDS